jgi:hypothetical protein
MLVGSNEEGLDLLPALVDGIGQGSISGIKTRCGVTFEHLSWKLSQNKVLVTLCPAKDRNIRLKAGQPYDYTIQLKKGKLYKVTIDYQWQPLLLITNIKHITYEKEFLSYFCIIPGGSYVLLSVA